MNKSEDVLDLSPLGLDGRDARIYQALLQSGLSSIRKIADYVTINRGSTYDSIKKLVAAGLVNFQQTGVNKKYFAEDPQKIIDLLEQKKSEIELKKSQTQKLIPGLLETQAYSPYANIKFYEDHEGIAVILRDVLTTVSKLDDKTYRAISSKPMRQYLYKKFPNFTKQRLKNGLFVKVISIGASNETKFTKASRVTLSIPDDKQPSSYTIIYGNKVAYFGLNDDINPYGVVIEDQGHADMLSLVFDQLDSQLEVGQNIN